MRGADRDGRSVSIRPMGALRHRQCAAVAGRAAGQRALPGAEGPGRDVRGIALGVRREGVRGRGVPDRQVSRHADTGTPGKGREGGPGYGNARSRNPSNWWRCGCRTISRLASTNTHAGWNLLILRSNYNVLACLSALV